MNRLFFTSESKTWGSLVWFLVAVFLCVLDVGSRVLLFGDVSTEVNSWFGIRSFANYNFAFSIALPAFLMYGIYLLILTFVGWFVYTNWPSLLLGQRFAWVFIICGAWVNVLERMYLGYVRDFIQIGTGYINLGDVYIILGVAYLLYFNFRYRKTI